MAGNYYAQLGLNIADPNSTAAGFRNATDLMNSISEGNTKIFDRLMYKDTGVFASLQGAMDKGNDIVDDLVKEEEAKMQQQKIDESKAKNQAQYDAGMAEINSFFKGLTGEDKKEQAQQQIDELSAEKGKLFQADMQQRQAQYKQNQLKQMGLETVNDEINKFKAKTLDKQVSNFLGVPMSYQAAVEGIDKNITDIKDAAAKMANSAELSMMTSEQVAQYAQNPDYAIYAYGQEKGEQISSVLMRPDVQQYAKAYRDMQFLKQRIDSGLLTGQEINELSTDIKNTFSYKYRHNTTADIARAIDKTQTDELTRLLNKQETEVKMKGNQRTDMNYDLPMFMIPRDANGNPLPPSTANTTSTTTNSSTTNISVNGSSKITKGTTPADQLEQANDALKANDPSYQQAYNLYKENSGNFLNKVTVNGKSYELNDDGMTQIIRELQQQDPTATKEDIIERVNLLLKDKKELATLMNRMDSQNEAYSYQTSNLLNGTKLQGNKKQTLHYVQSIPDNEMDTYINDYAKAASFNTNVRNQSQYSEDQIQAFMKIAGTPVEWQTRVINAVKRGENIFEEGQTPNGEPTPSLFNQALSKSDFKDRAFEAEKVGQILTNEKTLRNQTKNLAYLNKNMPLMNSINNKILENLQKQNSNDISLQLFAQSEAKLAKDNEYQRLYGKASKTQAETVSNVVNNIGMSNPENKDKIKGDTFGQYLTGIVGQLFDLSDVNAERFMKNFTDLDSSKLNTLAELLSTTDGRERLKNADLNNKTGENDDIIKQIKPFADEIYNLYTKDKKAIPLRNDGYLKQVNTDGIISLLIAAAAEYDPKKFGINREHFIIQVTPEINRKIKMKQQVAEF